MLFFELGSLLPTPPAPIPAAPLAALAACLATLTVELIALPNSFLAPISTAPIDANATPRLSAIKSDTPNNESKSPRPSICIKPDNKFENKPLPFDTKSGFISKRLPSSFSFKASSSCSVLRIARSNWWLNVFKVCSVLVSTVSSATRRSTCRIALISSSLSLIPLTSFSDNQDCSASNALIPVIKDTKLSNRW